MNSLPLEFRRASWHATRWVCIAAFLALLAVTQGQEAKTTPTPAPPEEPHARGAVLLQGPDGVVSYDQSSLPGPGKEILVVADSSVPASILIAAFDRTTRKQPEGLLPVFVTKQGSFEEVVFPEGPKVWSFEKSAGTIDVFVIAFPKGNAKAQAAQKLVNDIASATEEAVRTRAGKAMHQLIQDWLRERDPQEFSPRYRSSAKAAVTRGSGINWQRTLAYHAPIKEQAPAILMFSVGGAK